MAVEIERKAYGMNEEILKISIGDNSDDNDIEVNIAFKKKALTEKLAHITPSEPEAE